MIKLNILAVGKLKERFWREAAEEYRKRIQKYGTLTITEVNEAPDEGPSNAERQKEEEGKQLIKRKKGFTLLLDIMGNTVDSEDFAAVIAEKCGAGVSEFTFIIGGSRGVSEEVRTNSDMVISFGAITYPHQLMRVMLAEQLYRALTIINKTPYHK